MPCLNLDVNYFTNIKVVRLVSLLGEGAEIYPIKLWCYAAKHHTDNGFLKDYTDKEIAHLVGFKGDASSMLEAMLKVGLVEKSKTGIKIHEWEKHEGHLLAYAKRARNAARIRWEKIRESKHTTSMPQAMPLLSSTNKRKTNTFTTPQPQEVTEYAKSIGFVLDGQHFCDFYEARGWKIGNTHIKSWKACVRTWKNRNQTQKPETKPQEVIA